MIAHELAAIWRSIHEIKETQVSQQEEINVLSAAVTQVAAELETDVSTLQAELDKLETEKAAGAPLDLSALKTAVEGLAPKAKALGELKPAEKAPGAEAVQAPVEATKAAAPTKTVYVFTPAEGIDVNDSFTDSGFRTPEGKQLWYFSGDTQPGETTGTAVPGYTVYEGVAAAA